MAGVILEGLLNDVAGRRQYAAGVADRLLACAEGRVARRQRRGAGLAVGRAAGGTWLLELLNRLCLTVESSVQRDRVVVTVVPLDDPLLVVRPEDAARIAERHVLLEACLASARAPVGCATVPAALLTRTGMLCALAGRASGGL